MPNRKVPVTDHLRGFLARVVSVIDKPAGRTLDGDEAFEEDFAFGGRTEAGTYSFTYFPPKADERWKLTFSEAELRHAASGGTVTIAVDAMALPKQNLKQLIAEAAERARTQPPEVTIDPYDAWAGNLIKTLRERGELVLSTSHLADLPTVLAAALERHGLDAAAVAEELVDHPAVADLFVDDDTLFKLMNGSRPRGLR